MANQTAISSYYDALAAFKHQDVSHEQAIRLAFATLLDSHARERKWTLVQEQKLPNPNRPDDPDYIIRLVGQVITVSLETNRIVSSLPALTLE